MRRKLPSEKMLWAFSGVAVGGWGGKERGAQRVKKSVMGIGKREGRNKVGNETKEK